MYSSEKLTVKTHKMTELSGITVTPGVLPPPLRESLGGAIDRIGAKIAETVRIDTTHFVCTEGRGDQWQRACDMNIPIVRPEWVEGCEREGRIVGVRGYYLDANPKLRQVGQGVGMQQQQQQQSPRPQQIQRTDSSQTIPYRPQQPQQQQQQQSQPPTPSQPPRSNSPPPTPSSPRRPSSTGSSEHGPPIPEKDTPAPQERPSTEASEDMSGKSEERDSSALASPTKASKEPNGPGSTDEEPADDSKSFSTVAL